MKAITCCFLLIALSISAFAVPPAITSFSPASAATGTTVTINGSGFTGATAVGFGGTPALSFTVVSDAQITAVVAAGSSGSVQITNADGTGSRAGFVFLTTGGIITDFSGYWPSTSVAPNGTPPDDSHNLLAFTYNGATYSTGVNDVVLDGHSVTYTPGNFRALPVSTIAGVSPAAGSGSVYLALASKVDGSATVANTPAVASFSVKSVLTDGAKGLNLGTGVTNLPFSAEMTFNIFSVDPLKIADNEPDILLTQIAAPSTGNDVFSFIDGSNNVVGNTVTQDMTLLPSFGTWVLDLFTLTPSTPYDAATAYSAVQPTSSGTNTTRPIRLVGFKLSDFGITAANVGQIKAFRIAPSNNSDYAFIAYNANAIGLTPAVSRNDIVTNTTLCSGGTAHLSVVATPSNDGTLSYAWEESADGGNTWTSVTDGGNYSGATTNTLAVVNPTDGYRYRVIVTESGNSNPATSSIFSISIVTAPTPPSSVTISPNPITTCLNTSAQFTSSVTGGSNLYYQWQIDASGSFADIPGATLNTYAPPVNQAGTVNYRVMVSSGSGCTPAVPSPAAAVVVNGISSTTPAGVCQNGSVTLNATATSGTVNWYTADAGGAAIASGNAYTTPVLSNTTTYYVATSACAAALRVPVTATVYPASIGGTIAGGTTVMPGTNSTTLTLSGITGNVVKWQSSTDNFNVNINDIANSTTSLVVTNLTQTTQYRSQVQSGSCAAEFSSIATIVVAGVMPIHLGSVKANAESNGIMVQWTAYDQENTTAFVVERSEDGVHFTAIYSIPPTGHGEVIYQWLDKQPGEGYKYYRIKEVFTSGNPAFSAIVRAKFSGSSSSIAVYPNPVRNSNPTLHFSNMRSGMYEVRLINSFGQLVQQMKLNHTGGTRSHTLPLQQKLAQGVYKLNIISATEIISYSVVIL
jgi:hypothetical protein